MTPTPFFGAYHTHAHPLEHRGLSVHVTFAGMTIRRSPLGIAFGGSVDAEGLASSAPFDGRALLEPGRLRVKLVFTSDAGVPHWLDLVLSLAHPTVRSVTAFDGELHRQGEPIGRAQVRIDWRRALGL